MGSSQTYLPTGGPGALPQSATLNDITARGSGFNVPDDTPSGMRGGGSKAEKTISEDVHVFILDTIPPNTVWESAYDQEKNRPGNPPRHKLRKLLENKVGGTKIADVSGNRKRWETTDKSTTIHYADGTIKAELEGLEQHVQIRGHDYDMSDHGIFIASEIREIAPHANLHLVQVLNKYGVGSFKSLAAGFQIVNQFRQDYEAANGHKPRIIVNCSFTFGFPIDGHT
jgi:hypothetical protein